MRNCIALVAAVGCVALVGCGERTAKFDGPTVDKFVGKVVHNGKPVAFPDGEEVSLKLFHEKGQSFGIPLKPDGAFEIGWMPVGKYSVTLIREKQEGGRKGAPNMFSVPGGMTIEDGKTEYTVDLGKSWKL